MLPEAALVLAASARRRLAQVAIVGAALMIGSDVANAEVLFRWDRDRVPAVSAIGPRTLVVPAGSPAARAALDAGHRVWVEVDGKDLATFEASARIAGVVISGHASGAQVSALRRRLAASGRRVRVLETRGKWPHIRSNWVTSRNGVLQVSSSTAQPWVENNLALMRLARQLDADTTPLVTYGWQPLLPSGADEEPDLDDYLVAIGEASGAGADIVLPLHERFQERLLLGLPEARAWWRTLDAYAAFDAWDVRGYRATADVGVVTAPEPLRWFEVMNLLSRHNLPFRHVPVAEIGARDLSDLDLLVVLDEPTAAQALALAAFAQRGGTVVLAGLKGTWPWHAGEPASRTDERTTWRAGSGTVIEFAQPVTDPNVFALEMRALVGDARRAIQIWNGITVLASHYTSANGDTTLVTLLNYARQPVEIQVRVPGTFAAAYIESPEDGAPVLLPFRQRGDGVEFVLPALRHAARVVLRK